MWKDLSMKRKAALIKEAVRHKINTLDDIKNSYDDGGYLSYMDKLAKKKAKDWGEDEDLVLTMMLNDNTYNYKAFYDNDRERALAMLTEDPNAHFSDVGKTVYHPTFSNESIYSGKKSQYNPRGTVGGTWSNNEYIPSKSQLINKDFSYENTRRYLEGTPEYVNSKYNKFDEGGPIESIEQKAVNRAFSNKKPASNYSDAVDMNISKVREILTDVAQNIHEDIPTGLSNCTLTASQWINPNMPIGRASTIVTKPREHGYTQIGEEHLIPGTMVIASKDPNTYKDGVDNVYHSMLLTGFAENDYDYSYGGKDYKIKKGEPLVTYSRGKNTPSDYRENIPLRVYNDQGDGKTYNRYYKPIDPNMLQVLFPEVTITAKRKKK